MTQEKVLARAFQEVRIDNRETLEFCLQLGLSLSQMKNDLALVKLFDVPNDLEKTLRERQIEYRKMMMELQHLLSRAGESKDRLNVLMLKIRSAGQLKQG